MSQKQIDKFEGLYVQPNSFSEVPEGACEEFHNCVVSDKNVINKIRGSYKYYEAIDEDKAIGIYTFSDYLIVVIKGKSVAANRIFYFTNTGTQPNLFGIQNNITLDSPVQFSFDKVDQIPEFNEASGNLYFTSDDGLLKLSGVPVPGTLYGDTTVMEAGAPPGIDIGGYLDNTKITSFWRNPFSADFGTPVNPQGISVSYKVLFSYIDLNNNNILGTPSGSFTLTNTVYQDEAASMASATTAPCTAAGPGLVITVTSTNHGLQTGDSVIFSGAAGAWLTPANAEGTFPVTYLTANTFSYTVTVTPGAGGNINYKAQKRVKVDQIAHGLSTGSQIQVVQAFDNAGPPPETVSPAIGTFVVTKVTDDIFTYETLIDVPAGTILTKISYITNTQPILEFGIPDGISTDLNIGWSYRIYRTSQQLSTTGNFSDYRLIAEEGLTLAEINAKAAIFYDNVDVEDAGGFLYTNTNTGDPNGILATNDKPPLGKSLALYQKYQWIANVIQREFLDFSVINPTKLYDGILNVVDGASYLEIGQLDPDVNPAIESPYSVRRYYKFTGSNGWNGNRIHQGNVTGHAGGRLGLTLSPNNTGLQIYGTPAKIYVFDPMPAALAAGLTTGVYYLKYLSSTQYYLFRTLDDWINDNYITTSVGAKEWTKFELITNSWYISPIDPVNDRFGVKSSWTATGNSANEEVTVVNGQTVNCAASAPGTTVTVDSIGHGFQGGESVDFFGATGGWGTPANAEGIFVVTRINNNQFRYSVPVSPAGAGNILYRKPHLLSKGLSVFATDRTVPPWFQNIYKITSVPNAYTFVISGVDLSAGGTPLSGNLKWREQQHVVFDNQEEGSLAVRIRDYAESLVKAINRDPESPCQAVYTSLPADTPGAIRLTNKSFTNPIILRVPSEWYPNYVPTPATDNQVYFPTIPTTYNTAAAPVQVYSVSPPGRNRLFYSKFMEPEAFPLVNYISVGSSNDPILSIHALTNSLIVIKKKDGVFRVSGDNPNNFNVSLIDSTIECVGTQSAVLFSNQVAMLSNQGVCLVNETAVEIISRPIENEIQYALDNQFIDAYTFGFAYEKERSYYLSTLDPTGNVVNYIYNILTDTWCTSDNKHARAAIGPDGRMFYIGQSNVDEFTSDQTTIYRERNNGLRTDYSNNVYAATVISSNPAAVPPLDQSNKVIYTIESNSYIPSYGDLITVATTTEDRDISQIKSVTIKGPQTYEVTFFHPSNIIDVAAEPGVGYPLDIFIYEAYESVIKFVPFSAGSVGVLKQFAQFQCHTRDITGLTALDISYATDTYGDSEVNKWETTFISDPWGSFPWGCKYWGSMQYNYIGSVNTDVGDYNKKSFGQSYKTNPAPICRVYVSKLAQRSTYIQAILKHKIAGDRLNIQALNMTYYVDGERVSK